MDKNTKRVRLACYSANITMSIVGNLSSLLFLTFHNLYGVSFSLLGMLVLINFSTQLLIDLLFSFFSHKFNIPVAVKLSAIFSVVGLLLYASSPFLFSDNIYVGIVLSTLIFSAGSGLNEVLISPLIAALPSDNPEREMSKAHSLYAWGVVAVVIFSTLFLLAFGNTLWYILPALFSLIPLFMAILLFNATLPHLDTPKKASGALHLLKNKSLIVCVLAIFLGGATELIMTQWCSSYLEQALGISKVWGDVFGMATFALMLGLGRTLYAKYGKNIEKVLFLSGVGATACYIICILSPLPVFGLIACALTGFCVAMMWPGSLVVAADRITAGGVFVYAIMAAGGDLGAAVGPQLMGIITDFASANPTLLRFAEKLGLTMEQFSMKLGMSIGVVFAFLSLLVFLHIWRTKKKYSQAQK